VTTQDSGRRSSDRHLDFAFTPVPRSVRVARRRGRLSVDEGDILSELWDRASTEKLVRKQRQVSITLERLSEAVRWTKTPSALSKLLHRLRDKGWLSWEDMQGKEIYEFGLSVEPSELLPKSVRDAGPRSKEPSVKSPSANATVQTPLRSEAVPGADSALAPKSPSKIPKSAGNRTDALEPQSYGSHDGSLRGSKTFQRNLKPSMTTDLLRARVLEGPAREELEEQKQVVDENSPPKMTDTAVKPFSAPSKSTRRAVYRQRVAEGIPLSEEEIEDLMILDLNAVFDEDQEAA
jgi:hypothetical protein